MPNARSLHQASEPGMIKAPSHRRYLVYAAGVLYTVSLHSYVSRDVLGQGAGIQGVVVALALGSAFVCSLFATRDTRRQFGPSIVFISFSTFGMLALASSVRSFNPTLSLAKGVLLFVVLGLAYMIYQAELSAEFFRAIYWSYIVSLLLGLALGELLPAHFSILIFDEFTGRLRVSVFGTAPGTMGETAAYLVLLAPMLFKRSSWISRVFLIGMNLAAGGKTSTAILLVSLGAEYTFQIRRLRSWRILIPIVVGCILLSGGVYSIVIGNGVSDSIIDGLGMVYGHEVSVQAVTFDGRMALWRGALRLIAADPLIGYGFDGTREQMTKIASWAGSSHNGFLDIALAGGLIGGLIFLVGVGGVALSAIRASPIIRRQLLLVFIYMMVIASTGITFTFPSFFGILILTYLLARSLQSERDIVRPPRGCNGTEVVITHTCTEEPNEMEVRAYKLLALVTSC